MNNILSNLSLSELTERKELARISSLLPENSTIVEVGTFMGGSASIMATANPTSQIHCFDLFEDDSYKSYRGRIQYKLFDVLIGKLNSERSIDNVRIVLKDYSNIHLYKLRSPEEVQWNTPIDLYFEDGIHSDPILRNNLVFWSKFVKIEGYIVMHDHRPWLSQDHYHRFIDVEISLAKFLANGYKLISTVHSLVIIQKISDDATFD